MIQKQNRSFIFSLTIILLLHCLLCAVRLTKRESMFFFHQILSLCFDAEDAMDTPKTMKEKKTEKRINTINRLNVTYVWCEKVKKNGKNSLQTNENVRINSLLLRTMMHSLIQQIFRSIHISTHKLQQHISNSINISQ